jgi:GxxExxY protein
MNENEVAKIIVDCAYRVHTTLGPGLLESVYEQRSPIAWKTGLNVERQKPLPVVYENIRLEGLGPSGCPGLVIVELSHGEVQLPKTIAHTALAISGLDY